MPVAKRINCFEHDGLLFDVIDSGPIDGEIVVLLHGWPQTAKCWTDVSAVLHDAGYRTIAPNQRGYSAGARPAAVSAYRIDRLVADIHALISVLGGRPVHLVGHDWGAAVAWMYAIKHPTLLRTLSTVSVPHIGAFLRAMISGDQFFRSYYMGLFQVRGLIEYIATQQKKVFAALLKSSGMSDAQLAEVYHDIIDQGGFTPTINWYRAMLLASPKDMFRKVSVPTLYVWGDQDSALSQKGAELCAKYVTGPYRLEIMPGVNHWIPEQNPEQLGTLLLNAFTMDERYYA